MFIRDFNPNGKTKITNINKLLKEQFNMTIKNSVPKREKLETIKEMSQNAIIKLKNTTKKFQLEPEYAKYLGIKDVIDTMLAEGYYAESPAFMEMKGMLVASVQQLMDGGYTVEEASSECMNRFRQDDRYAHEDGVVLPIVIKAAKDYYESCNSKHESLEEITIDGPNTDLNEYLLSELSKEVGVELTDPSSIDAIEEKLGLFAEVSGKSRDTVVGFLNGLEEDALSNGIKFFGAKVAQHNTNEATKYGHSLRDKGMSDEEIAKKLNMKSDEVKDMLDKTETKESMFDDIIDDMLSEEIEGTTVEEAEVVMAVRALADDIQDQVERLGRMKNEDIPAIADSMVSEFGLEKSQGFKEQAEQILDTALAGSKAAKEGIDGLIGSITGVGSLGTSDLEAEEPMGLDAPVDMDGVDPMADLDVNEPAAAGPEDEPLGRAPVEV